MTEAFYAALRTRLGELTQDLRFFHKPTNSQVAPEIIDVMAERPTAAVDESEAYPFVRWIVYQGEFSRLEAAPFALMIDGGVYTEGDIYDGNADISRLCTALGRIVERPAIGPCKVHGKVRFTLGTPDGPDNNPGAQPHPYYHCRLFVNFLALPARRAA